MSSYNAQQLAYLDLLFGRVNSITWNSPTSFTQIPAPGYAINSSNRAVRVTPTTTAQIAANQAAQDAQFNKQLGAEGYTPATPTMTKTEGGSSLKSITGTKQKRAIRAPTLLGSSNSNVSQVTALGQ